MALERLGTKLVGWFLTKLISKALGKREKITKLMHWVSLVAQWLRIHLPVQGTQVQALVQEDPTCRRATKPVHRNY